ncbi:MAG: dihydrofolate synthase, partial [Egibacteraceae bacterium]
MAATDPAAAVAALAARPPGPGVDLDAVTTLCELLGRPDRAYPSLRVAGSGTASTAAMISCLLGALGLNAGRLSASHLQHPRERIRVADEPITAEAMAGGLAYLAPFLAEVDARHLVGLTRDEVLAVLAFTQFADAPVDVAVLESAPGVPRDATDLVDAAVAVVGPIGEDDAPGRWYEAMVAEGTTVVSVAQPPAAAAALEALAAEHGARLVLADRDFGVEARELAFGGQLLHLRGVTGDVDEVLLPLHGAHQAHHAAVALAAVEGFLGFAGELDAEVLRTGFAAVRRPGELEVLRRDDVAAVVLDVANDT